MATITNYTNQFYHPALEPLDSSDQVQSYDDLYSADDRAHKTDYNPKTVPYVGKLVHVIDKRIFYVCYKLTGTIQDGNLESFWRPLFKEDGTELYLTTGGTEANGGGKVLKLSANIEDGVPRLKVSLES